MNIEYLRNFIKLTHYKSFSDLAKDLPISQSTLSHQISQLEKDFGNIVLINRTTKKFELTEAGNILLNYAEQIVDLYDTSRLKLSKYKDKNIEQIIISASTIPGSHILPKYIAEFRNKNPNVDFKVLINNSQKSIENLNKKLVDFAGIGSFISYNEKNYDTMKIGEEELKFICSPKHELVAGNKTPVKFNSLLKFPFIWREKGSGMRDIFQQQFPDYKNLNIKLEVNDNDSIITTVSESNYISVMSEFMVNKAQKAGLIQTFDIKEYPNAIRRPLFFIKLKKVELSSLKNEFWEYLKKE